LLKQADEGLYAAKLGGRDQLMTRVLGSSA
jgi:PleD family two-component response regulator